MANAGIFDRSWIPSGMQLPRSGVRRITGSPPGSAYSRSVAGLGDILPPNMSPCDAGMYYVQPMDPTKPTSCAADCPPGWLVVVDQNGTPYGCVELPNSDSSAPAETTPPVDPGKTCTDAGGVYNLADSTCAAPAPATPGTPVPVPPPPAPLPPVAQPATAQAATVPTVPVPTWVYVGGGIAAALILGVLVSK